MEDVDASLGEIYLAHKLPVIGRFFLLGRFDRLIIISFTKQNCLVIKCVSEKISNYVHICRPAREFREHRENIGA